MFRAYAKINLGLLIINRRPDGYHNIETVFHRVDLYDVLRFEPAADIHLTTNDLQLPTDERNICHKAAVMLRRELGTSNGVQISLQKSIPVGGGLGGGSADAAIVLQELPGFWGKLVDPTSLLRLALQLGSDVPFFLGTGSALARGRGEILEYFDLDVPYTILLCYPNIHISTAWAYEHLGLQRVAPTIDLRGLLLDGMKQPIRLVNGLRNDFEPVIFREYPEIMRIKEMMMRGGAEYASLSGSGSSVFGLFRSPAYAEEVAARCTSRGYRTFITEPHFSPG
jgi:4-diphosphocytidyl-2-C-methyl-D-erythritol kinase